MKPKATVCLVDDEPSVLRGLSRLLRSTGHEAVVVESGPLLLERPDAHRFDCIILDYMMEPLDGLEVKRRLNRLEFSPPVLFLSGHADIPTSVEAMKLGARDFLTKPIDHDELLEKVATAVAEGRERRAEHQARFKKKHHFSSLSPREHEVLRCLLSGALNKQVAAKLGICEKTVKVHRARVLEKTRTHSMAELAREAAELGIKPIVCGDSAPS